MELGGNCLSKMDWMSPGPLYLMKEMGYMHSLLYKTAIFYMIVLLIAGHFMILTVEISDTASIAAAYHLVGLG